MATDRQLSEDARMQLAMAAGNAERSNRPRYLVVGAICLLVVAVLYVGVEYKSYKVAVKDAARFNTEISRISVKVAELEQVKSAGAEIGFEADPRIVAKMEDIARAVGLTTQVEETENRPPFMGSGLTEKTFTVTVRNQQSRSIVQWLAQTLDSNEITGLELFSITLKPGTMAADGQGLWNLDARFRRWERKRG